MRMQNEDSTPSTKGDLKGLQSELESKMATKTDLKALQNELESKMATKTDLAALRRDFALEIVKTNAQIDRLDDSFSTQLSAGVSKILKTTEDFMAQVQKVDRHQIITSYRVDELDKRVQTLEAR